MGDGRVGCTPGENIVSIGRIRIQRSDLPLGPAVCPMPMPCVYRKDGICDEPRINKGNSDAGCWDVSNREVLRCLIPITEQNGGGGALDG